MKKLVFILVAAMGLLAACGRGEVSPTSTILPTAMGSLTAPSILAASATPSGAPAPTRTATATRKVTATPRPTGTPTATWLPTEISMFPVDLYQQSFATPTPIDTPDSHNFKLKEWTASDSITLIQELEQYARANDVCFPFGCNRNGLIEAQAPIELALLEAMSRFPEQLDTYQFQWRLALARVIRGSHASDEWLLAALEQILNEKHIPIEQLDNFVRPYGFQVTTTVSWGDDIERVPNLFGNGQTGIIYRLGTQNPWTADGLFFAISDDHVEYNVIPIYSHWSFDTGEDFLFDTTDHTKNGVSELVFHFGDHSGSMCQGVIMIFEWQEDRFVELSGGNILTESCDGVPAFGNPDQNGFDTISTYSPISGRTETFGWNGTSYELVSYKYSDSITALPDVIEDGQYEQATNIIQTTLNDWPPTDSYYSEDQLGDSYPDYLRFQLGMIFALQSKAADAKAIFQELVTSPVNPLTLAVSNASSVFLQNYEGDADVYRACQSALKAMEKDIAPYQDSEGNVSYDDKQKAWGYDPFYSNGLNFLCNPRPAFGLLVHSIQKASDPVAAIQNAGAIVRKSAMLDLDSDGDSDWVLIVERPGRRVGHSRLDLWAIISTPNGFHTQYLDYAENWSGSDQYNLISIEMTSPNAVDKPLLLVRVGEYFYIFHATVADGALESLYDESGIRQYNVTPGENAIDIELWTLPNDWNNPWQVYRWDAQAETFSAVNRLKEMMFFEHNPAGVIPIVPKILNELKSVEQPDRESYYTYLLALAYDLTGDEASAVQTYWQLWRDYPESPYALIARAKLEATP